MAAFTPRPYQRLIIDHAWSNPRCNVFASPGMGKTGSTIELFSQLKLFGEVERLLILAPKRVAEFTWPAEIEKWRESFGHLSIAVAVGTPAQRLAAVQANADITCTNYENVEWLIEQCGENWPFDMVVADEVSRLRGLRVSIQRRKRKDGTLGKEFLVGQGGKRAFALATLAHRKVKRWVGLTGSPAPNGIEGVWAVQWFVDGGKALGNSFDAFSRRWFRPAYNSTPEQQRIEPLPHAQGEIQRLMRPTTITVDAKDWFDIKQPIERHIMVDLPSRARQQYKEMQDELFTWLGSGDL